MFDLVNQKHFYRVKGNRTLTEGLRKENKRVGRFKKQKTKKHTHKTHKKYYCERLYVKQMEGKIKQKRAVLVVLFEGSRILRKENKRVELLYQKINKRG